MESTAATTADPAGRTSLEPIAADLGGDRFAYVATSESIDAVENARDQLGNLGIPGDRILVLCMSESVRRELYSRQLLVNAPRRHARLPYRLGLGALAGAAAFGIGGMVVSGWAAVAGAAAGVVFGATVGMIVSLDSHNRSEANELVAKLGDELAGDTVGLAVLVDPKSEDELGIVDAKIVLGGLHRSTKQ